MPKFAVTYENTTFRYKKVIVEAENPLEADDKAWAMVCDEDCTEANGWEEGEDGNTETNDITEVTD